ncbi:diguanylate cyclase [Pseudomonas aeruginosa]|nr:diguanylate cyclase [Pseudomonas aeruginosa]TEP72556.1 diguanylate cyclase [Pseudomonas aeruginosa]
MGSAIAVEPVDHCQMVMANAPGTRGDLIQFIEASSAGRSWLVLHLDIANFRYFNQMLGWRTADDLLALIGQALVHDGRHRWYRVGGDEWVGICEGRSTEVGVTQVPAIR